MATHKTLEAPCCSGEILHTRLTEIKCSRWSRRSECSDKIEQIEYGKDESKADRDARRKRERESGAGSSRKAGNSSAL